MKDKMLARGNGEFWYDDEFIHFFRYLTSVPLAISLQKVSEFKIGKWHAGKRMLGLTVSQAEGSCSGSQPPDRRRTE
jgi:hypothetical protein